jgi:3-oxoadipate enol-lactonase
MWRWSVSLVEMRTAETGTAETDSLIPVLGDPTVGRRVSASWFVRSAGSGPAVVWIHGYTMDSRIWEHIWSRLPGFRHIGVDLPGHGRSPALQPRTRLRELAEGVAEVLRVAHADRLVALSMGTMVAFEVAIGRLHSLAKLAVVAPAVVGMPAASGTAERYRELTARRRAGATAAELTELWMSSPPDIFTGLSRHPDRFGRLAEIVRDHSWAELDFGGPAAFYAEPQDVRELPGSARELLVLGGDQDMPEFRDLGRQLAAGMPGAQVRTLPGVGHLPLLEAPDESAPLLAEFLATRS